MDKLIDMRSSSHTFEGCAISPRLVALYLLIFSMAGGALAQSRPLESLDLLYAGKTTLIIDSVNHLIDSFASSENTSLIKDGHEVKDSALRSSLLTPVYRAALENWVEYDSQTVVLCKDSLLVFSRKFNSDGSPNYESQLIRTKGEIFRLVAPFNGTYYRDSIAEIILIPTSELKQHEGISLRRFASIDKRSWMWVGEMNLKIPPSINLSVNQILPGIVFEYRILYGWSCYEGKLLRYSTRSCPESLHNGKLQRKISQTFNPQSTHQEF